MALAVSFETALQTRILAVLETLEADGVGVWGDAPADAARPLVRIDRVVSRADDSMTRQQREIFAYLSVHSDVKGNDQAADIVETVRNLLHNQESTLRPLPAGYLVLARVTTAEVRRDDDEVSYTGAITLRAVVQADVP